MITVQQAREGILENSQNFGEDEVPFLDSVGRVLKETIVADRDFPPFNRVAMDGIAINYACFAKGKRHFDVEGVQAAGSKQLTMQHSENCIEVMTGAVLPNNCDTVIRYEDVDIEHGVASILLNTITAGQNVHPKGKDKLKNEVLISPNTIISAAEIGVLATVGKSTVKVARHPKIMIVSTGDELVGVDEVPEDHQIRRSNVFTLVSLLERLNIPSKTAHITDDKPVLKSKIEAYLQDYDVLMFSGAVSKGKYDFLPEVLQELGVEKLFHKVAQRPGKPFWFGVENQLKKKTVVFAFPGNPISTFVNCLAYFYPWYYKSAGLTMKEEIAILDTDVVFKPNLTYFLQVKLSFSLGKLMATPVPANGSGDLASLVKADAFIQIPKSEETIFKKGAVFPVIRYRF